MNPYTRVDFGSVWCPKVTHISRNQYSSKLATTLVEFDPTWLAFPAIDKPCGAKLIAGNFTVFWEWECSSSQSFNSSVCWWVVRFQTFLTPQSRAGCQSDFYKNPPFFVWTSENTTFSLSSNEFTLGKSYFSTFQTWRRPLDTRSLNRVSGTGKILEKKKTDFRLRTSVSRSKFLKFPVLLKKMPHRGVSGPTVLNPGTVDVA